RLTPADLVSRVGPLLKDLDPETRLAAVRLLQLALGDLTAPTAKGTVWEGYSARRADFDKGKLEPLLTLLRGAFPSGQPDWDREATRVFAMVEDDDASLPAKVMTRIDQAFDPVEDLHYLI